MARERNVVANHWLLTTNHLLITPKLDRLIRRLSAG